MRMTNISTDNVAWMHYTGLYTVPAGQFSTFFGFKAVSTSTADLSVGNMLDSIVFTPVQCIRRAAAAPRCESLVCLTPHPNQQPAAARAAACATRPARAAARASVTAVAALPARAAAVAAAAERQLPSRRGAAA